MTPSRATLLAGGVALTAYVAHQSHTIRAAEPADNCVFIINGFYMAMREKFTKPGASIYYYLVEWDAEKLSWEDFRGKVLGATDPSTAEAGSLRREIFSNWKQLGLSSEPNVGDNGVHASASPFEALAERLNWMSFALEDDAFGRAMLQCGIPKETIMTWTKDPQVLFEGKKASLFDLLEDLDYDDCLKKAQSIVGPGAEGKARPKGKMQAYVFIKPHAVTPESRELVGSRFVKAGMVITKEGSLDAEIIEKDKLIDNHYYAIANKASLSKPSELNPPVNKQLDFEKKFGISWESALRKGIVYNAVDGCKKLGIDGEKMDKTWASAKKAGDLVKFGGGFYAGRIPVDGNGKIIEKGAVEKKAKGGEAGGSGASKSSGFVSSVVLTLYALLGK